MKRTIVLYLLAIVAIVGGSIRVAAEPAKEAGDKAKSSSLTVAVLDFQANTPGSPDLGKDVSDTIAAMLSGQDGFTMVDRTSMGKVLKENALNLTGLVNVDDATKIGKIVGAKILISGRIFVSGKQMFFTVKLIGVETSILEAAIVTADVNANLGATITQVADEVAKKLREKGPKLVARPDALDDPIPGLKKTLAGHKLPILAIHVQEHHNTLVPGIRVDPAVETEIELVLKDAGFTIIGGAEKEWAEGGVTVVIGGDGFSEFAANIANLISCTGRVEIWIKDRKTSEVLYVDRETTRGVDLSENIAAKSALQKSGHIVAIRILRHFAETLNGNKADQDDKDHPDKKKPKGDE